MDHRLCSGEIAASPTSVPKRPRKGTSPEMGVGDRGAYRRLYGGNPRPTHRRALPVAAAGRACVCATHRRAPSSPLRPRCSGRSGPRRISRAAARTRDDRDARCRRALEALSRLQKSIETIWEVDAADDGGIWKTVVRYVVTRSLTSCEVRQHGVSDRHAPLALQQRNIVVFGAKFMQVVSRDRTRRESA